MPYSIELCDEDGRAVARRVWRAPPKKSSSSPLRSSKVVAPARKLVLQVPHGRSDSQIIPSIARRSVKKAVAPPPVRYSTPPLQIRKGVNNIALSRTTRTVFHPTHAMQNVTIPDFENSSQSSASTPSLTYSESDASSRSSASPRTICSDSWGSSQPPTSPKTTCSEYWSSSQSSAGPLTPINSVFFPCPEVEMLENDESKYFFQLEESMLDPFTLIQGYYEGPKMMDTQNALASDLSPLDAIARMNGVECY